MATYPLAREKPALAALLACALIAGSTVSADAVPLARSLPFFTFVVENAPPPKGWVQFCKQRPDECRSEKREPRTPAFTDERMAELQRINLTVNRQIKPMTDLKNYGVTEKWTYPDNGRGDCEDYVLLKRRKLIELGWPPESLLITIVWSKNEGHTVLLARTDQGEYVLDNMNSTVFLWSKTRYDFVKRQSEKDPNAWVYIDGKRPSPAAVAGK
jgi:predicted transglutaminase-like cysteine proteinase